MASVVMLVTNDAVSDPRVNKEAEALSQAGYQVTVLAWDRTGEAPATEERGDVTYERLGPRAPYGGGVRSLSYFRQYWSNAAERVAQLRPDLVHCHDLDTAPAGLRMLRSSYRPRLVLDMHELYRDSNMVPQRGVIGALARAAVRLIERRALKAADRILVANPGTIDYYASLGVADKVVLVENAPDADLFHPHERAEDEPFTVGYFGQKRYPEALDMLMDVVHADPEMNALLMGGGTAAEAIARRAVAMDRIEVSGRFAYTDLPGLYGRCDVVYAVYDVVLGNVRTLFPVKVMEAMACGLPVVVASGTWIGDYVTVNRLGVAVPADDPEALADALCTLRSDHDLRHAMGECGRRIVEEGLNWRASVVKLVDAYADIPQEA
ncbi:MAG: glycosyltransferase family 4 protein [Coriobacteriia bacterium]|nr:glycosyltransferase family 4 protein [Coriobacteriia bacterium]